MKGGASEYLGQDSSQSAQSNPARDTRLPPHSLEAEQGILACIIHAPLECLEHCAALDVKPESFYDLRHRTIYEAMVRLCMGAKPIDQITLIQNLKDHGKLDYIGGIPYLSALPDATPSAENIGHYIAILLEKAVARETILLCSEVVGQAYGSTSETWLSSFREKVIQLRIGSSVEARPIGMLIRPPSDDPTELIRHRFLCEKGALLINGPTGMGKCLGRGTPILMFDGTLKNVEEIKLGDVLMGPDSYPRTVLGTCSGTDELYRVTQKQGDPYIVNSAHILCLKMTGGSNLGSRFPDGAIVELPTTEYLRKSKTWKHCAKGWKRAVFFPSRDVPLPPYFLGLWLGDGTSANQSITSADPEVAKFLQGMANGMDLRLSRPAKEGCLTLTIVNSKGHKNPIREGLRGLAVMNNKHVPHLYKCNSESVRLELLAGLIDSDGHYICGCFDYCSKFKALAVDVAFLARSVGLAATVISGFKKCQNGNGGNYYRVFISGDISRVPTRIARKQARPRKQKKNVLLTGIKVEPVGLGEYFGFQLDGDGRFLLGDFTVTHNSSFALQAAALWANSRPFFGMEPVRPLRTVLIQAENDDGDLAEMRDGISKGLNFNASERTAFFNKVFIQTSNGTVGRKFCHEVVQPLLITHKPSLLMIDPANSFMGGDNKEQRDVGAFLRTWLNPLLHAHNCACVMVHHTNKPSAGKEKPNWRNGEWAYAGSGSAEWANWARAVMSIQDTGTHGIYRLHAAKRGVRLHWRNPEKPDEPIYEKLIGHSLDPSTIYWRDALETEIKESDAGRPKLYQPNQLLDLLDPESLSTPAWFRAATDDLGISRRSFYREVRSLEKDGRVIQSKTNRKWSRIISPS